MTSDATALLLHYQI